METVDEIKVLRKIQHLVLIREEALKVGESAKAEELAASIERLLETLSFEARALQGRLFAKNPIFMSALAKGSCSGCGIKVPTSQMQHVIKSDRLVGCSNCGRLLYLPEVKATGVRAGEPDPKFLLSRYSTGKLMVPNLKATTREAAIAELCAVLAKEKVFDDPDKVVAGAIEREGIMTTAVGNGLAFPHMRGVEEGFLTFAAGISAAGIDWGGKIVNLVIFTALPVIASPFYLKLIAAFAKTFEDGEKLPFLLAATDAKTMWKELNKATRVAIKNI